MKKTLLLGGALLAAAVTAVFTTNTVSAGTGDESSTSATTTTTAATKPDTSNATFTILDNGANADGKSLYLTAVPSFTFGSQNLTDLMKGDVSFGSGKSDNNGASVGGQLGVADYSQTDKGWNVTAKVGDFTGDTTKAKLTASSLAFTIGSVSGDNVGATDGTDVTVGTTDIVKTNNAVLTAKPGFGEGQTTAQVTAPSLTIAKNVKAKADTYTGQVTWTVDNGTPKAPAAD
ncbi:WxL domain-containing protein [Lacticaseibacillus sp. GG6-2]